MHGGAEVVRSWRINHRSALPERKYDTNLSLVAPSRAGRNLFWTDDVHVHVAAAAAAAMLLRRA